MLPGIQIYIFVSFYSQIYVTMHSRKNEKKEPEFKLCWVNLCTSDKHYTQVPRKASRLDSQKQTYQEDGRKMQRFKLGSWRYNENMRIISVSGLFWIP